ncbi:MAG TPA: glycosyltransferase family 9 protein [Elusimicrobiales bacterium]|nr:glycosyltransferase family 9 protein [Elusimicrobiales bacterium]
MATETDKDYKRILLILIGRLGDYIVTTPFLEGLRRRYPGAEITLITSKKAMNLAASNRNVDRVLIFRGWHDLPGVIMMFATAMKNYDLAIDLNPSYSRSSLWLIRAGGARERLTFEKKAPAGTYTSVIKHDLAEEHFLDKYVNLAGLLGFVPPENMNISLGAQLLAEGEKLYKGLGFAPGSFAVAIHPGNFKKYETRWPEKKFVEFTKELMKIPGVAVFYLVGLGEEKETADGILRFLPGIKHIPPKSAELTGAILKNTGMLVCNSTGTLHLAAAVGVPTFSFNRPYTEKCWKPRGEKHFAITSAEGGNCREIPVADAVKAFRLALEKLGAAR